EREPVLLEVFHLRRSQGAIGFWSLHCTGARGACQPAARDPFRAGANTLWQEAALRARVSVVSCATSPSLSRRATVCSTDERRKTSRPARTPDVVQRQYAGERITPPPIPPLTRRSAMNASTEPALAGSELKSLLTALIALKKGETGVRLPVEWTGVA